VIAALSIIGYGFVNEELEERGRPGSTAIQVDDTHFRVDYFASRLGMYIDQNGGPGIVQAQVALPAVSDLLTTEEIVRRFASEFDVAATEDEMKDEIANRLGITVDDASFDVIHEQELARSDLSESDYRDMVEAAVLTNKLREIFSEDVPESAESVHYRQILVSEQGTADEIRDEIEGGADFAALAAENSLDTETKDDGGDVGWVPRGVLDASTEELLFAWDVGEVNTVPVGAVVFVIEMLEKAEDRAVDESQIQPLTDRAFDSWVQEKTQSVTVVNNMDLTDGDVKKIEWAVNRARQS
jgi:parvulin-like peptidyl-prolyl isomerase